MRTIPVIVSLPVEPLVEALGPEILKAFAAGPGRKGQMRQPRATLRLAAGRVTAAMARWEIARHTPGERDAYDNLIASVKGLQAALEATKGK